MAAPRGRLGLSAIGGRPQAALIGVGSVALVMYLAVPGSLVLHAAIATGIGVAGAAAVAWATWRRKPVRPGLWLLLATGLAAGTTGSALVWLGILSVLPPPTAIGIAGAPWLVMYALIAVALTIVLLARREAATVLLDAATTSVALATVVGVYIVEPALRQHGLHDAASWTQLVKPAADVIVFGLGVRLLFASGRAVATRLLAGAALAYVIADLAVQGLVVHGVDPPASAATVGFLLLPLLAAAAALHPSMTLVGARNYEPAPALRASGIVLLGVAAGVAPALDLFTSLTTQAGRDVATVITTVGGTIVLVGLVVARMLVLLFEARRLTAQVTTALDGQAIKLREAEVRYRQLIEHLPLAVFLLDLENNHVPRYMSPQIEGMLGHPLEQWMTRPDFFEELLHPEDLASGAYALGEGREQRAEFRLRAKNGDYVWCHGETSVLPGPGGSPDFRLGFFITIVERKGVEEERDRVQLELQASQKLEAVGQLAAGIAHEINTPIQFVGDSVRFLDESFTSVLQLVAAYRSALEQAAPSVREPIELAEEAADLPYVEERVPVVFERVYTGVERVTTLVKAMKSFSHSSTTERSPADLNEAIEATLTVARSEYKYIAEVELELGELPSVLCNRSDLSQVFLNLIVNAAHAIEDAARESGLGTIRVTSRSEREAVVITIEDDGCGIPADIRTRIFDPFFTTKEVGRGSGQGLTLSRVMVERNGGTLSCTSAVGVGTTFEIRLPNRQQPRRLAA